MLPHPIPYSELESLSLQQLVPFLAPFFLILFSSLSNFLSQLRKRLLGGIGFLSAILDSAEIRLFCSIFLKPMAISGIVHHVCAPMLLAKVAMFLGVSFLRNFGRSFSARLLATFLVDGSFLIWRASDLSSIA